MNNYKRTKLKSMRLGMNSTIEFGTFKGKSIKYVMKNDMGYLKWIHTHIKRIKLSKEILAHLGQK